MGVEKHLNDARLSKSNSVDLYRPPALRNNSVDDTMRPPELVNHETTNEIEPNVVSANGQPQNAFTAASTTTLTSAVTSTNNADKQTQQKKETATRRERRPDRAVYVPRARRSQTTPPTATTTTTTSVVPTPTTIETAAAYSQQQLAITSVDQTALVANTTLAKTDVSTTITSSSKAKKVKTSNGNKERKERAKKPTTSVNTEVVATETKNNLNQASDPTDISIAESKNSKSSPTTSMTTTTTSIALQTNTNCDNGDNDNVLLHPIEHNQETDLDYSELTEHINTDNMGRKGHNSKSTKAVNANTLRIEDVASNEPKCDNDEQELQRASKEINRSNRRIMKQTFVSDVLEIPDKIIVDTTTENGSKLSGPTTYSLPRPMPDSTTEEEEEEEDDWENMFDETGECLDPKIMEELTASVGKVKIELPKMDYTAYLSKQAILNEEEFPHVLEVSNFPTEFKTPDLLMVFSQYKESGFDIKWVDDTHALAVFSSSNIAAEVLTMGHPFVVLKPLAEATVESRQKAKKCATSLQPYKPRPETCAALARRMVTSALGVRHKASAAERENEKRVLREAKERKLLAAKQRDEAWES